MAPPKLTVEQTLDLLQATPRRIGELTAGLTEAQLHAASGPGEWSVNENLAHLRACADVRGAALRRILAEDHPTIRAINPRRYITTTDYVDLAFETSFRAFTTQRAELLGVLEALPPDAWSRSARITGAGKPLEWSVQFYAEWIAVHERPHINQIGRAIAAISGGLRAPS